MQERFSGIKICIHNKKIYHSNFKRSFSDVLSKITFFVPKYNLNFEKACHLLNIDTKVFMPIFLNTSPDLDFQFCL